MVIAEAVKESFGIVPYSLATDHVDPAYHRPFDGGLFLFPWAMRRNHNHLDWGGAMLPDGLPLAIPLVVIASSLLTHHTPFDMGIAQTLIATAATKLPYNFLVNLRSNIFEANITKGQISDPYLRPTGR